MAIFTCLGLKHRDKSKNKCSGCRIITDGTRIPDRCVFTHGPILIIWEEELEGSELEIF
jgi:hypothetical protein